MKRLGMKVAGWVMLAGLFMAGGQAATTLRDNFASAGTAIGATNGYYVIPIGAGKAVVTYINATSDASTNYLWFYKGISGAHTLTIATNASQAVVYVPDNTKYTAADVLVIQHITDDSYERAEVSSAGTTGQITLARNLGTAIAIGDKVWKMTSKGKVNVGNATKEIGPGNQGIYFGHSGQPTLVEVNGTSAATLNLIAGYYAP